MLTKTIHRKWKDLHKSAFIFGAIFGVCLTLTCVIVTGLIYSSIPSGYLLTKYSTKSSHITYSAPNNNRTDEFDVTDDHFLVNDWYERFGTEHNDFQTYVRLKNGSLLPI